MSGGFTWDPRLPSQSSGGQRASITFAEKAAFLWRGRVGTAWPMLVICCKTPERKDGSPQKVEPGSKEGRGGNPKSLGCPYKLSHGKISVGGHHLGPGRPERGSCLLGECSDASYC